MVHHHRSQFKQQNKSFNKTSKRSKKLKGRQVNTKSQKTKTCSKKERIQNAKNERKMHQMELKRKLSATGSPYGPPKLIAFVPLCTDIDMQRVYEAYKTNGDIVTKYRNQHLSFICPKLDVLSILDAVKMCDFCVFVVSGVVDVDSFGEQVLSSLMAFGIPDYATCLIQGLSSLTTKQQEKARKNLQEYFLYWSQKTQKLYNLENETEIEQHLRFLSERVPQGIQWRDQHPYIVVEETKYLDNEVVITGFVRGNKLSPNNKIHIPECGDFDILSIVESPKDPNNISSNSWYPEPKQEDFEMESDFETENEKDDEEEEESKYEEQMDIEQNEEEEEEERVFPDEINVPDSMTAQDRLKKYRPLRSFHKTKWEQEEELPKFFKLGNVFCTKNRITKLQNSALVPVGLRVSITLLNVPPNQKISMVHGLLPNEEKTSICHFTAKKQSETEFGSKQKLLVCVGFRKFVTDVLFSKSTKDGGNHVFRYLKSFNEPTAVGTFVGKLSYQGPVLVFSLNNPELLCSGSVLLADFDRILVRRICLTGFPFKIHTKTAVIRGMFKNVEDIEYYKHVELHTKQGKIGHIKDPLGTHGGMKCVFDGQLAQNDTVFLYLYKRIFPKTHSSLFQNDFSLCRQDCIME